MKKEFRILKCLFARLTRPSGAAPAGPGCFWPEGFAIIFLDFSHIFFCLLNICMKNP